MRPLPNASSSDTSSWLWFAVGVGGTCTSRLHWPLGCCTSFPASSVEVRGFCRSASGLWGERTVCKCTRVCWLDLDLLFDTNIDVGKGTVWLQYWRDKHLCIRLYILVMAPVLQQAAPATSSVSFYEPTEHLGFYKLSHKHLVASHWGRACKAECVWSVPAIRSFRNGR